MKKIFAIVLLLVAVTTMQAQTGELPRSTPAQQGLSTLAVSQFVDFGYGNAVEVALDALF